MKTYADPKHWFIAAGSLCWPGKAAGAGGQLQCNLKQPVTPVIVAAAAPGLSGEATDSQCCGAVSVWPGSGFGSS